MNIGIIFAMEEELDAFKENQTCEKVAHKDQTVFIFRDNDHVVYALRSGIGKVNAASRTTWFLEHYSVDCLINVGVAGGVDQPVETIVLGKRICYHDVDVTAFNYRFGQIPGMPEHFESSEFLTTKVEEILKDSSLTYAVGTIASGDAFVTTKARVQTILQTYDDVYAIEMEAASIAHVAALYDMPFLAMRSISDTLDSNEQSLMYETFLKRASSRVARVLWQLLKAL